MAVIQRNLPFIRQLSVLPLYFLLLAFCASPAQNGTDTLIQKVEKRYNSAQTLSVNFVEKYSLLGHARPPETGTLTLRKQGKMRWDYTQPAGKLFISDGKQVYLYTSRDNRVEKIPLKETQDMRAPLAFLLGRLDLKKEFQDFQTKDTAEGTWLDAAAKNDRVPYSSVDMLLAPDGTIRQVKILGRDQSVMEFSFSGERLNPPAPDALFHFDIPPGAEVVDSVGISSQDR